MLHSNRTIASIKSIMVVLMYQVSLTQGCKTIYQNHCDGLDQQNISGDLDVLPSTSASADRYLLPCYVKMRKPRGFEPEATPKAVRTAQVHRS